MKKTLCLAVAVLILSGCASIVKGRNKTINIMTNTGEEVEVNVVSASGVQTIVVPSVTTVKRNNQDITITVKATSCTRPSNSIVSSKLEPWFLGNFILGGLLGSSTDAITGSMWTYDDNIVVPVYTKEACKQE